MGKEKRKEDEAIKSIKTVLSPAKGPPTTHIKPVLQQVRLLTGLNVSSGKTRNIDIQLVLQQCCKTTCKFLLPVLTKLLCTCPGPKG